MSAAATFLPDLSHSFHMSPLHDSPLREPRFRRLWAGQGVSSLGNALTEFALGLWIFQQTGSATLFGASLVAVMLPMIKLLEGLSQ